MNSTNSGTAADRVHLKKVLGPVSLWGLGVGYVISGDYFGWNHGLARGGTFGMLAACGLVTLMYVAFVFSYTEMACAIPRAGGVFVYGVRALGLSAGFLGGVAQAIEFVFAPPAIAMAFGAYVTFWWPALDPKYAAIAAYVAFTLLNIWGVQQAAAFELVVTIVAVCGLVLFTSVVGPHFEWRNFSANAWPAGWSGVLGAVPFAIWFYLAIEGVANAAEEARHPQRDVAIGFGAAMTTLIILATCVLFAGVGVGGWEAIVYAPADLTRSDSGTWVVREGALPSDSPLPLALGQIVSAGSPLQHVLAAIGSLGIMASLNGIILIAGRAVFEMGRVGFVPQFLGHTLPRTKTPAAALLANMVVGILCILLLDTNRLITMAAMGAVTLYIVSMLALIRLRQREPQLPRPYKTPLYPLLPVVALILAGMAQLTMGWVNLFDAGTWTISDWKNSVTLWYAGALGIAFLWFFVYVRRRLTPDDIAHFHRVD